MDPNTTEPTSGIRVDRVVTIDKPPEVLFRFWRKLESLPMVMGHLESVTRIDEKRSHWVAKGPIGTRIEWDSEITQEMENDTLTWQSLEGSDVASVGSVQFRKAPGNRGTEVRVKLWYDAPGGVIGAAIAKLFGEEPSQQVTEDLRRFKQVMEAGEIPTTEGQPSGKAAKS